MRDARGWLIELMTIAPRVDVALLRVIARLLAAGDKVSVDVLLIIVDALIEAKLAAMLDMRARDAAEIEVLVTVVTREAERPRPGFW